MGDFFWKVTEISGQFGGCLRLDAASASFWEEFEEYLFFLG
jgi:hypothetical protein